jgi:hypothetical protein
MEIKCVSCGATLAGPQAPGLPFHCNYCGAPQPTPAAASPGPYGAGPSPYGAPPSPFGAPQNPYGGPQNPYGGAPNPYGQQPPPVVQLQGPGAGGPQMQIVVAVIGVMVALGVCGFVFALVGSRAHGGGVTGLTGGGGMSTASLATLSLAQTPVALAKVTGVQPTAIGGSDPNMMVTLSGGPYNRINFGWDKDDQSHVKMAYLYADTPPPNQAATHAKLATMLGPRFDSKGSMNWQGLNFSYDVDTAYAIGNPGVGIMKNPHWKEQVDAGWDVLRSVVLGLPVTVTDAEKRDWLGHGYTLASLATIDTTVDVDHATAMMQAAYPGVASEEMIGLRFTLAIDNPWFGEAELTWKNEKAGAFEEVLIRPPADHSTAFTNQTDIEACVQSLVGGVGKRNESDHLKADHDTDWRPAGGGEVRVYGGMVDVTLISAFAAKKMARGEYEKVMQGLDACGRKK